MTVGLEFTVAADSQVRALRYYRPKGDVRGHKIGLYSLDGTSLATARLPRSRSVGWQRVKLAAPVAVGAGRTYVVAYRAKRVPVLGVRKAFVGDRRITNAGLTATSGRIGRGGGFPARRTNHAYLLDVGVKASKRKDDPPPDAGPFPTLQTAGVPAGWSPARTVQGDLQVGTAGAVVEDVRVVGDVVVNAPNVTLRRIEVLGGSIDNFRGSTCHNGLVIEDTTVTTNGPTGGDDPAIGEGGYTARNVKIDGPPEGFRVSGVGDCGPVTLDRSIARTVAPDTCGDWHGDALQGYYGDRLTIRNSVLELVERNGCSGTAPFFYPADQGNTSVDIDGLVVAGAGYSFRLGTPGSVRNLHVVQGSWFYGPTEVRCSALSAWQASVSTLDAAGQPRAVRSLGCSAG